MSMTNTALDAIIFKTVGELTRKIVRGGGGATEVMMVAESVLLGTLLFNEWRFHVPRDITIDCLDIMTVKVLERLSDE